MKIEELDLEPKVIDFLKSEGYDELFEPQEQSVKAGLFDEKQLVEELTKTEKFTEEESKNFIRKMARDSSIYESKPGHYNRV